MAIAEAFAKVKFVFFLCLPWQYFCRGDRCEIVFGLSTLYIHK